MTTATVATYGTLLASYPNGSDILGVIEDLQLDKQNDLHMVDPGALHIATILPLTMYVNSKDNNGVISVRKVAGFLRQNYDILREIPMLDSVKVFSAKIVPIKDYNFLSFNTMAPSSVGDLIDQHTHKIL